MKFSEYYKNKVFRIAADLLALAILLVGFTGEPENSFDTVIYFELKTVFCLALATMIFWFNHGQEISAYGVNWLLFPRRFLKKAPPPLSQAQTLMLRGKWEEAEELLSSWHGEYPGSVSIALTLFELLANHFRRYDEALQKGCETLSCKFRSKEEEAVSLLEKCTDLFCSAGHPEKAIALLAQESGKTRLYAPQQIQYIQQRENALKRSI